jgi:hypothetical protein
MPPLYETVAIEGRPPIQIVSWPMTGKSAAIPNLVVCFHCPLFRGGPSSQPLSINQTGVRRSMALPAPFAFRSRVGHDRRPRSSPISLAHGWMVQSLPVRSGSNHATSDHHAGSGVLELGRGARVAPCLLSVPASIGFRCPCNCKGGRPLVREHARDQNRVKL